jgi:hypothetical protein
VAAVVDHDPLIRWVLFTNDAHGLYRQYGFVETDSTAMVRPSTTQPPRVSPPAGVRGAASGP